MVTTTIMVTTVTTTTFTMFRTFALATPPTWVAVFGAAGIANYATAWNPNPTRKTIAKASRRMIAKAMDLFGAPAQQRAACAIQPRPRLPPQQQEPATGRATLPNVAAAYWKVNARRTMSLGTEQRKRAQQCAARVRLLVGILNTKGRIDALQQLLPPPRPQLPQVPPPVPTPPLLQPLLLLLLLLLPPPPRPQLPQAPPPVPTPPPLQPLLRLLPLQQLRLLPPPRQQSPKQ